MGGFWRFFRRVSAASAITAGWVLLIALLAVPTFALGARVGDPLVDPGPQRTSITKSDDIPFVYGASREDPQAPCATIRHVARSPELPPPLPDAEAEAIRSPQQFAHVCADSRSPPLI